MKSNIIKSKFINAGSIELLEFKDDLGVVINYAILKNKLEGNSVNGASKIDEKIISRFEDAIDYFDKQK